MILPSFGIDTLALLKKSEVKDWKSRKYNLKMLKQNTIKVSFMSHRKRDKETVIKTCTDFWLIHTG